MKIPELKNFFLVGGTALSLCYGHRKSVDLDLFSFTSFETKLIIKALEKKFKAAFVNRSTNPNFGIFGFAFSYHVYRYCGLRHLQITEQKVFGLCYNF